MDVVVYLALAVLIAVFVISLLILICMCQRRYEYNRLLVSHPLRFSKLKHEEVELVQLSPHISQTLNRNHWLLDVNGLLQHCVAVLKLCHTLTDKLAKIPLNQVNPQLNDIICQATARVVPRFDDLLHTLSMPNVDIRLIEARVTALTVSCWSLVVPFYILDPKYKEVFGELFSEMESHQKFLAAATEQINNATKLKQLTPIEDGPELSKTETILTNEEEDDKVHDNRKPGPSNPTNETTRLGKSEELVTRTLLLDETTPPADPLTT